MILTGSNIPSQSLLSGVGVSGGLSLTSGPDPLVSLGLFFCRLGSLTITLPSGPLMGVSGMILYGTFLCTDALGLALIRLLAVWHF